MRNLLKTLSATAMVIAASSSFAENQPDNPWTDCGIGYALFQNSEIGAAISNVIWDAGTTATTTFVSSPDSCRSRDGEVAQFIGESFGTLEQETAAGSGAHLNALVSIANCDASSKDAFISSVRSSFAEKATEQGFEALDQVQKAESYYSIVSEKMNGEFASACSAS